MRVRLAGVAVSVGLGILGGCGGGGHTKSLATAQHVSANAGPAATPAPAPATATATGTATAPASPGGLKAAAQAVLAASAAGDWGTFWDHWDTASQALISRAEYVHRKQACPGTTGAPIIVVSERSGANGMWTVRGRRGGSMIVYQFRLERGQWAYVVTDSSVKAALKGSYDHYVVRPECTK